jgi:hypothetical protein
MRKRNSIIALLLLCLLLVGNHPRRVLASQTHPADLPRQVVLPLALRFLEDIREKIDLAGTENICLYSPFLSPRTDGLLPTEGRARFVLTGPERLYLQMSLQH